MSENETQTHYRTCNICEAMCGLEIRHRGNEILSIRGDNDDPFSRGHICPKAVALQDFYNDKDRLKTPLRRTADGWQEIRWDEAFEEIAARFRGVQEEHGKDAVGVYTFIGGCGYDVRIRNTLLFTGCKSCQVTSAD